MKLDPLQYPANQAAGLYSNERERQLHQFEFEKKVKSFLASDNMTDFILAFTLYPQKRRLVNMLIASYKKSEIQHTYFKQQNWQSPKEAISVLEYRDWRNYDKDYSYYNEMEHTHGIITANKTERINGRIKNIKPHKHVSYINTGSWKVHVADTVVNYYTSNWRFDKGIRKELHRILQFIQDGKLK